MIIIIIIIMVVSDCFLVRESLSQRHFTKQLDYELKISIAWYQAIEIESK